MTTYKTSDFCLEQLPSEYDHQKKYKITCGAKTWRVTNSSGDYHVYQEIGVRRLNNFPIGKQIIEFVKQKEMNQRIAKRLGFA